MLGKAVVQDAAHAAGRKRQNLILQELLEIDGLAAVLIRDDDDVVLADDPFADIRMLDISRYEGEVAAVTQHPFHQPVGTEGGTVFNLNRDLGVLVAVACEYFGEDGDRDRLKRSDVYAAARGVVFHRLGHLARHMQHFDGMAKRLSRAIVPQELLIILRI